MIVVGNLACSFGIGVVYASLLLSYLVIHSTILKAPEKGAAGHLTVLVTAARIILFMGVAVSLALARPLLQLSGVDSLIEPALAILGFVITMVMGWRTFIPAFVSVHLTTRSRN